jgi:hypothetical protein
MRWPNLTGPTYIGESKLAAFEQSVNLYTAFNKTPGAKAPLALFHTPGVITYATHASAPGRGIYKINGRVFVVVGTDFAELSSLGVLTTRGTVLNDGQPVTMWVNALAGGQLNVISGTKGYIYDMLSHAFTLEVDDVTMGGMVDGFFVALDRVTSILRRSVLLNGTAAWVVVGQRSKAPDPWEALRVHSLTGELWLLGKETGEVWYNSGALEPFIPREGVLIKPGICSPWSLQELNGTMIWLSGSHEGDGQIVRSDGYAGLPISPPWLDRVIRQYGDVDDAVGWTYQNDGYNFYVITFPSANHTWQWCEQTGWWNEIGTFNGATGLYERWTPQYHCHEWHKHLVLDGVSGVIHQMSSEFYTDTTGVGLRRRRTVAGFLEEQRRVFYDEVRLYMEVGVGLPGLPTVQGHDPIIMMRMSRNGGQTWGAARWRRMGQQGEFGTQVGWMNCGSAIDAVFEFAVSDPVPVRIIDGYLDIRMGR